MAKTHVMRLSDTGRLHVIREYGDGVRWDFWTVPGDVTEDRMDECMDRLCAAQHYQGPGWPFTNCPGYETLYKSDGSVWGALISQRSGYDV